MENTITNVSYPDALEHWDRSRAFGDTRDFPQFAQDMEELHPGQGFGDAAARDGWWTRLSTRLDQNVFHPVAEATTEPLGGAIGGLFGQEEAGKRVGRELPRALVETAPLYLLGPEAGIPATAAALGATGALMGAHTYAETGSPKAAAISGITGAALPGIGRLGGGVLPRVLGLAERVPAATLESGEAFAGGVLPKTGVSPFAFKTTRFAGSQGAMIGANEASMYATDKTLDRPFDPLSPDFWLQQIPFTVFDAVHGFSGKAPTAEEIRGRIVQPKTKTTAPYVPPEVSQPEADATIEATLRNLQVAYSDPNATPEQKAASLVAANALIQNPQGTTAVAKSVEQPQEQPTEITGYGRQHIGGNWKVLQVDPEGNDKTVWVNGVEPTKNEDGTLTFVAKPSQLSENVTSPLKRSDFGVADANQPELPQQAQLWPGFAPDQQRTLEEHGVPQPPAEMPENVRQTLRDSADQLELAKQKVSGARAKVESVPQSAEEIPQVIGDVEAAKPKLDAAIKSGATPTQAVERVRLSVQTSQVDEAVQQLNVLREQAKVISTTGGEYTANKPQAIYGDYIRNEDGENFPSRAFAEAYRDAHPEYEGYTVRAAGKGGEGFYLGRQINKEVSFEGTKLEKVLVDPSGSTALESRPDVSFDAALEQIQRASQSPVVFAREAGFDDVSDAILALRQAKVVFPLLREGKTFDDIQAALAEAKVAGFTSPRNGAAVMDAVREGLAGFTGKYRNFSMDSMKPFDEALVKDMGVLHPNGVENTLQWLLRQNDPELTNVQAFIRRVLETEGVKDLTHTLDPQKTVGYLRSERRIEFNWLPDKNEGVRFALDMAHEYMHHVATDLEGRSDPAAVQLRAVLTQALTALRSSPEIPAKIRAILPQVREWQGEYEKTDKPTATKEFYDKWVKAVGTDSDEWLHLAYGLSNEHELLAQLFGSPKLFDLASRTKLVGPERSTILQKLSQVVNRVFGGKPESDNALAQIMGAFDQYLSGSKVPPRDVKVGPTLNAGGNFFYGLAEYDPVKNVLGGKHKLPNSGVVTEGQLKSIGGIGKPLSDGEVELYKSIVPEAWDGGKVNVPKLVEGLKTKGPVVEVRKLGQEGDNTASQDVNRLVHELDTQLGPNWRNMSEQESATLTNDQRTLLDQYGDARLREVHATQAGTREGGGMYSFLAPKPESEMPGYVEGLVRTPTPKVEGRPDRVKTLYAGPHFGSEDQNVLAFFRGYEETLPDGTKAFHVIEVQSDWGQEGRKREQARQEGYNEQAVHDRGRYNAPDYPLLRVYESLALKAALAHAKEIGATKVILSDAETAMMTEGHDRAAQYEVYSKSGKFLARESNLESAKQWEKEPDFGKLVPVTAQEAGMRLHYDQTLPSAMEKLTGGKGEKVELGVHKNAVNQDNRQSADFERGTIQGSPVFRDEQGNPKSQITGRVYDISKTSDVQTLFENKTPSVTVRQSYNGRDFLRDSLIASGVRPEALASRIDTIESVFNTGSLQPSIDGFTREMTAGTLPATAEAGPLKPELTTALVSGTPKDVNALGKGLLMNEVPVHQELYQRMLQDFETAKNLYNNVRKGLIPGELPPQARENLQQAHVRLDALNRAINKQTIDIQRFNDLDNFTTTGMENTRVSGLSSNRLPAPPDPTEMQQVASEALGLVDARREVSREALERGKVPSAANWVRKTFMFTQYLKQLIPAVRPAFDHVFQLQGETNFWKNELDAVYGMNPKTKEIDKNRTQANLRVATNETLMRAASDIKLWNQTQEAGGATPSLDDPFVKNILARFNPKDRQDILTEANNAKAVHDHWTEVTTPRFLARKNMLTVAKVIALREQGMGPEQARDLAGQFSSAIDQLRSPQTAQGGLELLQTLRGSMQPNTYLAAFGLAKGLADDTDAHLEFMRSRPNYVTEQRIDGKHGIRMVTPDNKPYFNTFGSKTSALAKVTELEGRGYKYLEYVPAQDLNVPYRGVNEELIGRLRELDLQRQNREAQALQGLDPQIAGTVLAAMNRANDYEESLAAFSPVPGAGYPKRHFVAGREELNMVQQQNMFYSRATNWMRHQLTRGETELDLLDPSLLADREVTKLVRDHVGNVLTPDSQLARKMAEFTYNWKLAGNFGVNALHLVQSLNTGMVALISETGGVGDALALTIRAQKAVVQRALTGKWASVDHDWLDRRAASEGVAGFATWEGDIGDANRNALQYASTPLWNKPLEFLKWAARSWNNIFFKFNDRIGLISAFDLGRERGMGYDEAYNFARDVKNQGYFTGGKAQRSVNQWAAFGPQAKAVPQLMSSLQTYVQGWFSLLASNYVKGFGKAPEGLTSVQIAGAKKAFLYQLGAQAVLAGALGLPGVGQGMALVKQTTGVDVMSWLRQHLGDMFNEDQQAGGLMTSLALHGATAAFTPVDISGRHMPSVPYIGVTPYKGFDLSNLAGAPVSSAADLVKGLMAAAKGDTQGMSNLLPEVLRGPLRLWQGEGDIRDRSGSLITKLSPSEQFVTALGMKPSRVTALQDVNTAIKEANVRAKNEKSNIIDNLATIYRKNGVEQGHVALVQYLQAHPQEDGRSLVRAISAKVLEQTTVPDWSQRANVAADLSGLGGEATSQAERYSDRQDIEQSLGLNQRPNARQQMLIQKIDELRQSDPYLSVQEAQQLVRSQRPRRPSPFALQ